MPLTAAQITTLTTDISNNTSTIGGTQIKLLPHTQDNAVAVANWYNQFPSANLPTPGADFTVWRDLPMETVLNTITFANMTPADAVPTTPDLTVQVYMANALCCQGKQFNLQNLTIGRSTAPMKRSNYRAAMQDCLTNIPAGAGGSLIAANWTGVRDGAKFLATNAEKLFATGTGTTATPGDLVVEGAIDATDIRRCWGI